MNRRTPHAPSFTWLPEAQPARPGRGPAPYAVLPVPYERTVSYGRGTARAPAAILAASRHIEGWDEETLRPLDLPTETLPPPACRGGDEQALDAIRRAARPVLRAGRFLMALGGEHTISAPLIEAAREAHPDLTVLHLDAHLDLRDAFQGSVRSHGSVMRRVLELGVPIVPVGIRSVCAEEYRLIRRRALPVFWARDLAGAPAARWVPAVLRRLGPTVYVTLDADGLDPALMPGTGTPEPGGLGWYAVLALLRRVCEARRVVAADLVEVIPTPGLPASEYTAARLAAKLMWYHRLAQRPGRAPSTPDRGAE